MKKRSAIAALVLCTGAVSFFGIRAVRADREEPRVLPAANIALAIDDSEPDPELPVGQGIAWDAWAEPEAGWSWVLLNLPEETLEKLEKNLDQDDRPLF